MRKFVLFVMLATAGSVSAQEKGWQHSNLSTDRAFGISTAKAYELLKGKKSKKVIVAVIDSGVDTTHEDLHAVVGHEGWGFLGNAKGENVRYENTELVRLLKPLKKKFANGTPADTTGHALYETLNKKYNAEYEKAYGPYKSLTTLKTMLDSMVRVIGKENPTAEDFKNVTAGGRGAGRAKDAVVRALQHSSYADFYKGQVEGPLEHYAAQVNYHLNLDYDARAIVGDDPENAAQDHYGNADAMGPDATHGTHVAGIIGAVRGNGIGLDGIADNVEILSIRTVPDGDERDKDVANAVIYAVKHGARVINMSFGKGYATNKAAVDKAMKYAAKHDVLIVQAAGNDGQNIDSVNNFPQRFESAERSWIVVGASGPVDDQSLKASFSNYGMRSVDVFAPGVMIYSSVPGSKYDKFNGTSMAAPVVAGLAALIREYYPKMKAERVKEIILNSVVKRDVLEDKCGTGGVVNAYNAILLAQQ